MGCEVCKRLFILVVSFVKNRRVPEIAERLWLAKLAKVF